MKSEKTIETIPVDKNQVKLAVAALLAHINSKQSELKKKDELFEKDNALMLLMSFKKIPQVNNKPKKIPLPHSLNNSKEICLISKEPGKQMKELLQQKGVTNITKVISLTKLRKEYKTYQLKRELFALYDIFLCDDRIYHLVSKTLGKEFFKRKKEPRPIKFTCDDLKSEISKTLQSTLLRMGHGPSCSVKVGCVSKQSEKELLENALHAIKVCASKVPGTWKNVRCLHIKATNTAALPVYQSSLEVIPPAFDMDDQQENEGKTEKKGKMIAAKKIKKTDDEKLEENDKENVKLMKTKLRGGKRNATESDTNKDEIENKENDVKEKEEVKATKVKKVKSQKPITDKKPRVTRKKKSVAM